MTDDDLACKDVVELMTDYLEGAMPADAVRRLEHHLATCPGCTEYLEQLRAVSGVLEGLAEAALPAARRKRLIDALRDARNP
jgi:anti-sigma factor (TIGR02949 family)